MKTNLIDNIEIDGVTDYPDFANTFIVAADYNGEPMTDKQLEEINEDREFVQEAVMNYLT